METFLESAEIEPEVDIARRAIINGMDTAQLVVEHAPAPARLLEVGCGEGHLARRLVELGYDVVAIDPDAPEGDIFRRASLEEFDSPQPFDVVVARRSLHHIADLEAAVTKIHSLLHEGGTLILDEFAWDQMDARTAQWYHSNVTEPRPEDESLHHDRFPGAWVAEHYGLHGSGAMRRALEGLFDERQFERVPYIAEHYLKRPDLVEIEHDLIRRGAISALGFRYAGVRRTP